MVIGVIVANATRLMGLMDSSDGVQGDSDLKKEEGECRKTENRKSRKKKILNRDTLISFSEKIERSNVTSIQIQSSKSGNSDKIEQESVFMYEDSEPIVEESSKNSLSNKELVKTSKHKTRKKSKSIKVNVTLPSDPTTVSELQDQYISEGARPKVTSCVNNQSYSESSEIVGKEKHDGNDVKSKNPVSNEKLDVKSQYNARIESSSTVVDALLPNESNTISELQIQHIYQDANPKINSSDNNQSYSESSEIVGKEKHDGNDVKSKNPVSNEKLDVKSQYNARIESSSTVVDALLPNESNTISELQIQHIYQDANPKINSSDNNQSYSESSEIVGKEKHDESSVIGSIANSSLKVQQTDKSQSSTEYYQGSNVSYEEDVISCVESLQVVDTLCSRNEFEKINVQRVDGGSLHCDRDTICEELIIDDISFCTSKLSSEKQDYVVCDESVQKARDFVSNEVVKKKYDISSESPDTSVNEYLSVENVHQQTRKSDQYSSVLLRFENDFQIRGVFNRIPNYLYRKRQRHFTTMLKFFKDMHFYYCAHIIKTVFYQDKGLVYVHRNSLTFLAQSTGYYRLCIFLLKISCMVQFGSMFNVPKIVNGLIYNFKLFKSPCDLDLAFVGIINALGNKKLNLREEVVKLYKNRSYTELYMQDREFFPPDFFSDLLKMLCEFVQIRLTDSNCHTPLGLVDFIIVSSAMMIGTLYNNYRQMFHSISGRRNIESLSSLIKIMNIKDSCRGNLGLECYELLKVMLRMYNSNINGLGFIGNLYFPRILIQKGSKFFVTKIEQSIISNTMSFGVILEDLSLIICNLVDRWNVMACNNEISAYDKIYSELMHNATKAEEQNTENEEVYSFTTSQSGRSL